MAYYGITQEFKDEWPIGTKVIWNGTCDDDYVNRDLRGLKVGNTYTVSGWNKSNVQRLELKEVKGYILKSDWFDHVGGGALASTIRDAVKNAFDTATLDRLEDAVVANVLKTLNEKHNIS